MFRNNVCSLTPASTSGMRFGQCDSECWRKFFKLEQSSSSWPPRNGRITPCRGDEGTSLMVAVASLKGNEQQRWVVLKISTFAYKSTTATHSTWNFPCRYTTAGVFGKCRMDRADHTACCRDPVVYTRVANLADWIREKAPGARSNPGCPKKRDYRKIYKAFSSICNIQNSCFQMLKRQNNKSQSKAD